MRVKFVLLFCIPLVLLTGCGNRHELNNLGIASALSIDKKEGKYLVGVQLINPDGVRSKQTSGNSPVYTFSSEGETFKGALSKMEHQIPRSLFLSDLRLMVLSEEIARTEVNRIVDYCLRDPHIRSDVIYFVSKEKTALEILNQLTPIQEIPAESIFQNITSHIGSKMAYRRRTLNALVRDMEVKDILMQGVSVEGDKRDDADEGDMSITLVPSRLSIESNAIFRDNKFVGWTNEKEDLAILYLFAQKSERTLSIKIPDCSKPISITVRNPQVRITGKIDNKVPKFTIKLKFTSEIADTSCDLSTSYKKVREVERQVNKQIKNTVEEGIHGILRKYQADIFGFGWILRRNDPRQWKELEGHWREVLPKLTINVQVENILEGTGQIFDPIKK